MPTENKKDEKTNIILQVWFIAIQVYRVDRIEYSYWNVFL